ncbi:hypothetical protein GCM10017667_38610 [Streptomyces filamentosus]|uniref:Uncharacterized protein n=1 Tax=Streptomyces filamentosus TaxID=67294 RepID=A0A919BPE9_STRFL|nr:hypothetical protein GCM10017667_38610 [Streptomyces filamentosus]
MVAGRIIGDTGLGEQSAGFVDEGNVVVALCPVDAAEHSQAILPDPPFMQLTSTCGARGALIQGLVGPPSQ